MRSFSALQRAEIAEIEEPRARRPRRRHGFSALQRAEIAEITPECDISYPPNSSFSALQRAEIAEIPSDAEPYVLMASFSALQRAEIAEISRLLQPRAPRRRVSVLFNEPKLLKSNVSARRRHQQV